MPILNIFKKKKGKLEKRLEKKGKRKVSAPKTEQPVSKVAVGKKAGAKKKEPEKKPVPTPAPKPHLRPSGAGRQARKGLVKVAPGVLESPQITEKATVLQDKNQYLFKVAGSSTKPEIKKAVEKVYGVQVVKVRTITVHRRSRRLGKTTGWKKGYKKAIVTLKKGQTIELIPR